MCLAQLAVFDKESANCRMETNYAHQQELDMIPLMMSKDFKPKGWLGLILGTRMWCKFDLETRVRDAQLHGQQVAALQMRLEALHATKLLSDEELFALEDAIADADEAPDGDGRVVRMVALSVRMSADAAFSRQLRRKFM